MSKRQKRRKVVSAAYEDAGLFRNEVCEVTVSLAPIFARNSRDDIVVAGYVQDNLEVSVVFAGRRVSQARTLILTLKSLKAAALRRAVQQGLPPPDIRSIRQLVRVEGAWRKQFTTDPDGWEKRSYHLMAARWSYRDETGVTILSGLVPELGVPASAQRA